MLHERQGRVTGVVQGDPPKPGPGQRPGPIGARRTFVPSNALNRPFGHVVRMPWSLASGGWQTGCMQPFLAVLVGGLLTIAGGLAAVLATSRTVKGQWRNDTQLKVSTEVLNALQKLVSRINDLAYLADKQGDDAENAWSALAASVMEWHNVRHAALLVSSPRIVALLQEIDEQSESLTARARTKQWTLIEFRRERDSLSRLAADFLNAVRTDTGWPSLQLKSLRWIDMRNTDWPVVDAAMRIGNPPPPEP